MLPRSAVNPSNNHRTEVNPVNDREYDALVTLREIIFRAYSDGQDFVSRLPMAHDIPMQGWDGALQLQIVRHA